MWEIATASIPVLMVGGVAVKIRFDGIREGKKWLRIAESRFFLLEYAKTKKRYVDKETKEVTYEYIEDVGYYTLTKKQHAWHVSCHYTKGAAPFLSYAYDPKREIVSQKNVNPKVLAGWKGYMFLSQNQIKYGVSRLEKIINEEIENLDLKESEYMYKEEQTNKKEENKKNIFPPTKEQMLIEKRQFTYSEEGSTSIFDLGRYGIYTYSAKKDREKITYKVGDTLHYSVTRDMKTKKMIDYYIKPTSFFLESNITEYAKKEMGIWNAMREAISERTKREEQLISVWEEEKAFQSLSEWELLKKLIKNYENKYTKLKHLLDEENAWYIKETLPKRMKKAEELFDSNEEVSQLELKEISTNILKRIHQINEQIDESVKKEKEYLTRITEVEIH